MILARAVMIFMLMGASVCFADVDLYLYPRVERGEGGLVLSDIASIGADGETANLIGNVVIDARLHADGYLDRSDIMEALGEGGVGRIRIHGGGVRVVTRASSTDGTRPPVAIRKGAAVRFQVVTGNVRVEVTGIAMHDGSPGDQIPVQLKGKTVSRGIIVNDRIVKLEL